jgi:hypothetical protein
MSWNEMLASVPVYVLNMNKDTHKLKQTTENLTAAGFKLENMQRVTGFTADQVTDVWKLFGSPPLRSKDDFPNNKGKQACALGHYHIWNLIIANNYKYAYVFEDDVTFHMAWQQSTNAFWEETPKDFDIVYMGSSFDVRSREKVIQTPVFCTHAMIVSLEGARKALDICLKDPQGTWTIDGMLRCNMESQRPTLNWYVWNGHALPRDPGAFTSPMWQHNMKNQGLVFQDWTLGSDVDPDLDIRTKRV